MLASQLVHRAATYILFESGLYFTEDMVCGGYYAFESSDYMRAASD